MTPNTLSSSSITGNTVKNRKGEKVGTIKDLMIDLNSGEVEYAVLSFGGFLGIGDKYFAVPLQAMEFDPNDNENAVMDIDKDRLENAPGFDKDNWPNTSDDSFTNQVYNHYDIERRDYSSSDRDPSNRMVSDSKSRPDWS